MIKCPKCQAENRIGAKYCKECAEALPESPKKTVPLFGAHLSEIDVPTQPLPEKLMTQPVMPSRVGKTQPASSGPGIRRRPAGAIFGDQFLYKSLIYSDESQIRYLVTQVEVDPARRIRVCSNQVCGAFFSPREGEHETYCTDCGTALKLLEQELVLIEALVPAPESLLKIADKRLSHGNIRSPLEIFEEKVAGSIRYCMVIPQVSALETPPPASQALKRGLQLAQGLDYLHTNGITFCGKINPACFALDGDRAVWADFSFDHLELQDNAEDRSADVRSLAQIVFEWRSGKADYEPDPNLIPVENRLFETALTDPGFSTALEFASALEGILDEIAAPQAVDYRLGRRSHVGMLRNLNEDSMLTLELNRTQQSFSQPLGVYVVADGMGGHTAGEIASGAIVNTLSEKALGELMRTHQSQQAGKGRSEWLREAVKEANIAVFNLRKSSQTDMGSTLVAAVLEGNQAYIAHVGDSRAYLINSTGMRQLTTDHSLVERLIATNQITREEARYHPQRNVIYRTIGDKKDVDVEISTQPLKPGDMLLLCSDGLSGMVEDRIIQQIVREAASAQAACDQLIEAANAAGGDDNITAIVIQIVQA